MATSAHRKQVEQGEQVASARGYHAPNLFAIHTARAKRHSAVPVTDGNKAEILAKSA